MVKQSYEEVLQTNNLSSSEELKLFVLPLHFKSIYRNVMLSVFLCLKCKQFISQEQTYPFRALDRDGREAMFKKNPYPMNAHLDPH